MTTDAILLTGRDAGNAREVYQTHADRLAARTSVDDVAVATYESEPPRELRDELATIDADDVYAIPMTAAHSPRHPPTSPRRTRRHPRNRSLHGTHRSKPRRHRGAPRPSARRHRPQHRPASADVTDSTLVLAGFGSSSKPYHRQTANYHAARIRERTEYDAVTTCYLLQNPTVECARYDVDTGHAVAVPPVRRRLRSHRDPHPRGTRTRPRRHRVRRHPRHPRPTHRRHRRRSRENNAPSPPLTPARAHS